MRIKDIKVTSRLGGLDPMNSLTFAPNDPQFTPMLERKVTTRFRSEVTASARTLRILSGLGEFACLMTTRLPQGFHEVINTTPGRA